MLTEWNTKIQSHFDQITPSLTGQQFNYCYIHLTFLQASMSLISYSQFERDFEILKQLGSGNCASAYKVLHKPTKHLYALKLYKHPKFTDYAQLVGEIEIITKLDDPAIPKIHFYFFHDNFQEDNPKKCIKTKAGIIMELCDRTIEEQIKIIKNDKSKIYNQTKIWSFAKQMIRIFAKMQEQGFSHRDIKPGNIMIKDESQGSKYKVIDFGYALKNTPYAAQNITGTQDYVSPKIEKKFIDPKIIIEGGLTVKDDVYSLGKTILELIRCKKEKNENITNQFLNSTIRRFDPNICDLLLKMLDRNESYRWDFIQLNIEIQRIDSYQCTNMITLDESLDENANSSKIFNCQNSSIHYESTQYGSTAVKTKNQCMIKARSHPTRIQHDQLADGENLEKNHFKNSQQTDYFQSQQNLDNKIVENMVFSRCSFENEIHSIKVFEDFVLFGMKNEIGVLPLKHKNNSIYKLKPKGLENPSQQVVFTSIMIVDKSLIIVGTMSYLLHYDVNYFIQEMKYFLDNHESMVSKYEIKLVLRKSFNKKIEYREPKLYMGDLNFINKQKDDSNAKISCIEVKRQPFLGSECPVVICAHYDGCFRIFNQGILYRCYQPITDFKAFDSYKIVFVKNCSTIQLIEFNPEDRQQLDAFCIFRSNLPIKYFRIINKTLEKVQKWEDRIFLEVYQENGQKIYLDHTLKQIGTINLKEDCQIAKVIESQWDWSTKKEGENIDEKIIAERKITQSQRQEIYIITSKGQIISKDGCKIVVDLKMTDPKTFEVTEKMIVAADLKGNVKLLYSEPLFDNAIKPKEIVDEPQDRERVQKFVNRISKSVVSITRNDEKGQIKTKQTFAQNQGGIETLKISSNGFGRPYDKKSSNNNSNSA